MSNQKYCPSCGEANPSEAVFCANCGNQFRAASYTGMPPAASSPPYYEPIPPPRKRTGFGGFVGQHKVLSVIGVVVLLFMGLGCMALLASPSSNTAATATPTATLKATPTVQKASLKPTATPKATATPAATPESTNEFRLSLFTTLMEGKGYKTVTPFVKTTENGNVVYKGVMQNEDGVSFDMVLYPTSTYSDALSLQQQKIDDFTAKGYVEDTKNSEADMWIGVLGHAGAMVQVFDTSVLETPAVLVTTAVM